MAGNKYGGYQLSGKYLLGDVSRSMTPKGLHALKDVGYILPYYIANYKGVACAEMSASCTGLIIVMRCGRCGVIMI